MHAPTSALRLCAPHRCAGLLAAALAGGGLQLGLQGLQGLLWAAGLPASLPYAAMAAAYRWQLQCTAVMWRVMRGRQQLPRLRQHMLQLLLWWRKPQSSGTGAADASAASSGSGSGGGSLRQLCGSMLLFMPAPSRAIVLASILSASSSHGAFPAVAARVK